MDLRDMPEEEFRQLVSDHLAQTNENSELWVKKLLSSTVVVRTREVLIDLELDVSARIKLRRGEEPDWAKGAYWYQSLVRRRIAQANAAIKQHNVAGKEEAQHWQGVAVRLAQAIARHEARMSEHPDEMSEDDLRLWKTLDDESHPAKGSIRQWLMNLVVPEKYR